MIFTIIIYTIDKYRNQFVPSSNQVVPWVALKNTSYSIDMRQFHHNLLSVIHMDPEIMVQLSFLPIPGIAILKR